MHPDYCILHPITFTTCGKEGPCPQNLKVPLSPTVITIIHVAIAVWIYPYKFTCTLAHTKFG